MSYALVSVFFQCLIHVVLTLFVHYVTTFAIQRVAFMTGEPKMPARRLGIHTVIAILAPLFDPSWRMVANQDSATTTQEATALGNRCSPTLLKL